MQAFIYKGAPVIIGGSTFFDLGGKTYQATGKGNVDSDGTGPHHGDRTASNHTSYKADLNADVVPYFVAPPLFQEAAEGVVLGCLVFAENLSNGKTVKGLCGDVGPHDKFGEMSIAAARALGLNPSPVSGGTQERVIRYTFYTDVPAVIGGKTYPLEPLRR